MLAQLAGVWAKARLAVGGQHLLGQHRQTVHALTHIGVAAGQPDARTRWQNNHPRSTASTRRKGSRIDPGIDPHHRAVRQGNLDQTWRHAG